MLVSKATSSIKRLFASQGTHHNKNKVQKQNEIEVKKL